MSRQDGSASVLVLAMMLAVLAAGCAATALAEAIDVRHQAAAAADAAALAAAADATEGAAAACGLAARVARADHAELQACELTGAVATVTVAARAQLLPFAVGGVARLNARAGPAETYRDKAAPVADPS